MPGFCQNSRVYLSAEQPRWNPRTERDLRAAIADEILIESHFLDLKRQPGPGQRSANQETARDLAQFAIDGGQLIYGVKEGSNGEPHTLHPFELAGMAERLEQIALRAIDPPLGIMCHQIVSDSDSAKGYLVVEIPISPGSPHMVDGRYIGRGDKQKTYLTDPEVVRLHERRSLDADRSARLLEAYVKRDPVAAEGRQRAHFFVVAEPVSPRGDEMLLAHVTDWHVTFAEAIRVAYADPLYLDDPARFEPSLRSTHHLQPSTEGMTRVAYLSADRTLARPEDEDHALELEFGENGAVRLFTGRLDLDESGNGRAERNGGIMADAIVDHTRHVLSMARYIAEQVGYLGAWHLGVAATSIAGLPVYAPNQWMSSSPRYPSDSDEYRRTTTASYPELQKSHGALTGRLVGRLLRVLRVDQRYVPFLTDVASEA